MLCAVAKCTSYSRKTKDSDFKYIVFLKMMIWKKCGFKHVNETRYLMYEILARIYSMHFAGICFTYSELQAIGIHCENYLRTDAVPTSFLPAKITNLNKSILMQNILHLIVVQQEKLYYVFMVYLIKTRLRRSN